MRPACLALVLVLGCVPAGAAETPPSTDLATTTDLVARYPPTRINATAVELRRLAGEMGIDIAPLTAPPGCLCEVLMNRRGAGTPELLSAIGDYLEAARDPEAPIGAPPAALAAFSCQHRATLDAIRDLLVRGPAPSWDFDLQGWWDGPQPNPNIHLLGRVLLAQALEAVRADDSATALAWLEADWQIEEEGRAEPGWWAAYRDLRWAVLRRIEAPGGAWPERLARFDPRSEARAMQLAQAWTALQVLSTDRAPLSDYMGCYMPEEGEGEPGWMDSLQRFLLTSAPVRAYGRIGTREATARLRAFLDRIVVLDPCELMAGHYPGWTEDSDPWWNRMGNLLFQNQGSLWTRVGRQMLEAELTAKVLDARRARARTGAWPATIPGIETSACKGGRWRYIASADGGATIDFVAGAVWPGIEPTPLRFRAPN